MKKSLILLLALTVIIFSSTLSNNIAQALASTGVNGHAFKVAKTEQEKKIEAEILGKISKFKDAVDSDIAVSFQLNLGSFTKVEKKDIVNVGQFGSFQKAFYEVIFNQKPGDVLPDIYVKGNNGFILEKKSDGSNVIHTIQKKGDKWILLGSKSRQGKYIAPPM